jgi:alginate O-acetyltransferase complex protein AlgI
MRPFRLFLFLLIVLICFTGLSYYLPGKKGLSGINVFFGTDRSLITGQSAAETSHAVGPEYPDSVKKEAGEIPGPAAVGAAFPDSSAFTEDTAVLFADTLPSDPLARFLDTLKYSRGQVRIMYYGDSQVEGDRITSSLRRFLRKGRTGTGPGLFQPLMPVMYTESIYIRSSSNWKRYNYLSYKNGGISHNDLGPFLSVCRFTEEGSVSESDVKAWVRIVPSKFADSSESKYEWLRIFYGKSAVPVKIVVKGENLLLYTDTLRAGPGVYEFRCPLFNKKNILIEFSGKASPDIYGMSIESMTGIIVDNIPSRGSTGLEFTMIGNENLNQLYNLLSPDYVVLQFGLNIVRNIRSEYNYYQRGLSRQISLLREISPASQFAVIGVSDMARGVGDSLSPYRNIPHIVNAQKKAAEESEALFWNTWQEMGGRYSIVRWHESNPPLAQSDYAHFTSLGARKLAEMIYSDLFAFDSEDTVLPVAPVGIRDTVIPEVVEVVENKTVAAEKTGCCLKQVITDTILRYDPSNPLIFTSSLFWLFFLVVLAVYSLLYRKLFVRNLFLFLVSLYFYYKTGGLFLLLLILVTLIDYICGILISRSQTRFRRRFYVLVSVVSNLGILAYFKYSGFIVELVNDIFGTGFVVRDIIGALSNDLLGTSFDVSYIVLPVGISFFTFQSLSYIFDVYRNKCSPVRNVVDFGFYVSFFPQLVAGPIIRASEFIPQIYTEYNLAKREFSHAVFLIMKGLVKKIIISDFIAVNFIDRVFDMPTLYSGLENLIAVYGYGLQIYCDFSGYTDIAIGLGLILGFKLPLNFNSPYKALGLSDFWRRWHISLSRWLKDYLYIPLGGNRKGKIRSLVNIMITMLLGGLWHGANLRFLIWGGLHGLGLVAEKVWSWTFGRESAKNGLSGFFFVFLTFNFVIFCWIFFRSQDMHDATVIIRQIFLHFQPTSYADLLPVYGSVFAIMAAGYFVHFLPERTKESYRGFFINLPLAAQMVIVLFIAFLLYNMKSAEVIPFIYFRF